MHTFVVGGAGATLLEARTVVNLSAATLRRGLRRLGRSQGSALFLDRPSFLGGIDATNGSGRAEPDPLINPAPAPPLELSLNVAEVGRRIMREVVADAPQRETGSSGHPEERQKARIHSDEPTETSWEQPKSRRGRQTREKAEG